MNNKNHIQIIFHLYPLWMSFFAFQREMRRKKIEETKHEIQYDYEQRINKKKDEQQAKWREEKKKRKKNGNKQTNERRMARYIEIHL